MSSDLYPKLYLHYDNSSQYVLIYTVTDMCQIPFDEIDVLLKENRLTEAFFLARRMAAEGVEGAIEKVEEIRGML